MKRTVFILLAALFAASCSQLESGDSTIAMSGGGYNAKTAVSISGAQILAKAALPSTSGAVYGMSVSLTENGAISKTEQANGTLGELKLKTFSFEDIPAGKKVSVSCAITYCPGTSFEQKIFAGESDPITIDAGENNIAINMQKKYEDLGAFSTDSGTPSLDDAIAEYAIPYGYTTISDFRYSNGFQNLRKVIIPDTVTTIAATAFSSCDVLEELIFADTSGWTYNQQTTSDSGPADVSSPAANAEKLKGNGSWGTAQLVKN